jgi:hypothetical protein
VVILFEKIWWRLLTANIFAKHGEVGNQSLGRPVLSLFSNYKNAFKVIIAFNNLWNGHCLIWISVLCTCTYLRLDFSVMACITQTCCSVITMLEPYSIIKFVYMIINIVFLCIKWILGGVGGKSPHGSVFWNFLDLPHHKFLNTPLEIRIIFWKQWFIFCF